MSVIYNRFFYNLMIGAIDLDTGGDVIKCALLSTSHVENKDHNTWADVSANEVSGTGYVAGGTTLGSQAVAQDDTGDRAWWDTANALWSSATLTGANAPQFAVIYNTTVSNNLICSVDFGSAKECNGGDFEIVWATEGIIELEQGA